MSQFKLFLTDVVELKAAGNDEQATKEFEKIAPLSQQIADIINRIIEKI
ncbi:MAG: hypothetical protein KZQ64_08600 [gamma proteobacterium symbiont of Bathyaustriella thionipta]|nr:hypothetical protein [gamma proteobacterium symbiont of Bathyaustriella thionipta]MCU7950848.1 hypothetical protein [gamma proteobacterium symbiont of Bathyaustriella thionipta]MCU7953431.1 hypothetical protein [gamma proteobacterium symbiont of Bathyaustriella thionipta]MCU7967762.1 hypothetical protein [gamma proteobacterium symbiont of Bathyaustriella thionipta]